LVWKNKDGKALDMNAKGFGTLKIQTHQDVKAKGIYANGKWKVVFTRPLATEHPDEDTQISKLGSSTSASLPGMVRKTKQRRVEGEGLPKAVSPVVFSAQRRHRIILAITMRHCRGPALGFQFVLIRKLKKGQSA